MTVKKDRIICSIPFFGLCIYVSAIDRYLRRGHSLTNIVYIYLPVRSIEALYIVNNYLTQFTVNIFNIHITLLFHDDNSSSIYTYDI